MNIYDKLTELGITLPPVSAPAAAYVPWVQTGKLIFVSGNIARKDGGVWVGHATLGRAPVDRQKRHVNRPLA